MKRKKYNLYNEQQLWNDFRKSVITCHYSDSPEYGYEKEIRFFLPYVIFIDEKKGEIALANRNYRPLGIAGPFMKERPFKWIKADLSKLPEMSFVKEEKVNDRDTKCMSLYFLRPPYMTEDKEVFDDYLLKLAQLEKACSENFIAPRFTIATRDLYRLKWQNTKLLEDYKWMKHEWEDQWKSIHKMRTEIAELKKRLGEKEEE